MSANPQAKAGNGSSAPLSGPEKVAVLLLALGKSRSARLLKRFESEELKLLSRLSGDLRPITAQDLEALVEEFAQKFSSGVNFVGTEKEVKSLLSGLVTEDDLVETEPELTPSGPGRSVQIWEQVSQLKDDVLRGFLLKEHPQTAALILSKIDSGTAARIIGTFPAELRNNLLCRMLGIGRVSEETIGALETVLSEDLLAPASASSHAGIADILNRLDKSQSEEVLKGLAEVRPDDVKALRRMLFTFEELALLQPKERTMVFDQVPIERLVVALRGTEAEFQNTLLSSLAARSKRMVEAELQGPSTSSPREIADARRAIVSTVLRMIAKGEIELPSRDDDLQDITV
jgi:flagellar motor switch protein FliG